MSTFSNAMKEIWAVAADTLTMPVNGFKYSYRDNRAQGDLPVRAALKATGDAALHINMGWAVSLTVPILVVQNGGSLTAASIGAAATLYAASIGSHIIMFDDYEPEYNAIRPRAAKLKMQLGRHKAA